jgi:6-phosphofructokinase
MGKNAIVGQSGGPTSVINASLAGVFESCKSRGADIVYGMCNGVAGLLEERVVDLSTVLTDDLDIELLKRTPSSFLGSCRYKLPDWHEDEAVYKKLFAILEKLNIGYFFYIGGNDSMDTIGKLADYGARTDITEAYQVGGAAAKAAFEGVTGQMVALKRISNSPYQCTTELHPISEVANLEKKVPLSWMNENHTQMTEEFLEYARPLIQAELTPLYIAGLPHHIYLKKQK